MQVPTVTRDQSWHGWMVVAVMFVLLVGSFGTQLCFGLFLKPLTEEFGWSRAAASGAMSLLMAVSGIMGVVTGRMTDRWGARAAVAPGVVLGALGYLLLSRMSHLWEFYLFFGVGGGFLAGCSYTPAVTTVSYWFEPRRRTLAIGVTLLGVIAGQMLLSPLVSRIIEGSGWRMAWWVLSVVALGCGAPALVLAGRKPARGDGTAADVGSGPADSPASGLTAGEAAKTAAFWILMLSGAAIGLGFYAFNAHIISYAKDVGLSAETAALIFTVSGVGGALGTLLAGAVTGRLGHRLTLLLMTGLNAVAIFLFIPASTAWAFYLLGVVLGFAFSGAVPVRMAVIPPLFGGRAMGTIIGLASLSFSIGAIAGPFLAGYVFDSTGSYDLAFLIFGIILAAGTASLYYLRAPRTVASALAKGDLASAGETGIIP